MFFYKYILASIFLFFIIFSKSYAKDNEKEFNFGVNFEPQALTSITEIAPLKIGEFIRLKPAGVSVEFLLTNNLSTSVTTITPTGYYSLVEASSGVGVIYVLGSANAVITLSEVISVDPVPPVVTSWDWLRPGPGNRTLNQFGQYFYPIGARIVIPANSHIIGTVTRRFSIEVTGG